MGETRQGPSSQVNGYRYSICDPILPPAQHPRHLHPARSTNGTVHVKRINVEEAGADVHGRAEWEAGIAEAWSRLRLCRMRAENGLFLPHPVA